MGERERKEKRERKEGQERKERKERKEGQEAAKVEQGQEGGEEGETEQERETNRLLLRHPSHQRDLQQHAAVHRIRKESDLQHGDTIQQGHRSGAYRHWQG